MGESPQLALVTQHALTCNTPLGTRVRTPKSPEGFRRGTLVSRTNVDSFPVIRWDDDPDKMFWLFWDAIEPMSLEEDNKEAAATPFCNEEPLRTR